MIANRLSPMPSFSPFRRKVRRSLLIEINPFQVLAAGLRQNNGGPTLIDCAAEFAVEDDAGLGAWLDEKFGAQRAWVPAIGSIAPAEAVLRRENLQLRKLAEAGYLGGLLKELRRIPQPEAWTLAALDPLAGTPLAPGGTAHPGLLLGLANNDIRSFQQRLLDHRLLPHRIELGILPLLGAISGLTDWRQERRATVVVVIEQEHTTAYIIGKEGLHTPAAVPHGFASIVQAVRKEFGLGDAGEVRERLHQADDELLLRATKFVRAIGRDLKPLVDSYEMTTGQPVGEIYCAYLPPALQWIAEPLAQTMQRPALQLDCPAWLPTVGLQPADDLPPLGPHWLGALGLVSTPAGPEEPPAGAAAGPVPWRVDCRLPAQLPNSRLAGRRFAAFALFGALAAFALTLTLWQWYVIRSLDADTGFWNGKIASNQKLFNELIRATSSLRSQSARFDDAYALMQKPPPATDFILDLGRSLPPNMQVDRIESTGGRMAMRGSLREPPDQSSRTLGRYLEELRRTPAIGPLFSSIALTALQRANDSDDSLAFEITFTLAEPGGARP
jgi:hypothetical protein